jgi:hypothetical protein
MTLSITTIFRYAECRDLFVMLNVIMLSVVMLSDVASQVLPVKCLKVTNTLAYYSIFLGEMGISRMYECIFSRDS